MTTRLEIALEALQVFIDHEVDYMTRNKLGDPEQQSRVKLAREALAAIKAVKKQDPVGEVKQAPNGNIYMAAPAGKHFDMSRYIGCKLYAAPVESDRPELVRSKASVDRRDFDRVNTDRLKMIQAITTISVDSRSGDFAAGVANAALMGDKVTMAIVAPVESDLAAQREAKLLGLASELAEANKQLSEARISMAALSGTVERQERELDALKAPVTPEQREELAGIAWNEFPSLTPIAWKDALDIADAIIGAGWRKSP